MSFKSRLKDARQTQKLTQKEVAALIGVAKSTYAGYESGNSEPDMDRIVKLVTVLNVDPNYLFQDEMEKASPSANDEVDAGLKHIYENYAVLNQEGRDKLIDYSDDLVSSGRYIKTNTTGALEKQA